jgi:cytochrome c-type biogenesis protein CcmE
MDPSRKRKSRLVLALTAAVLLAIALIYTSFASATQALQPSELLEKAEPGKSYTLTGRVVVGSVRKQGDGIAFEISDRDGSSPIPATYTGAVPDPFRGGREIIITGQLVDGTFVGEVDTLITKCPSKFSEGEMEWVDGQGKTVESPDS